ncbi:hypothetical protein BGZ97_002182 [Linnemannia gamsii]|jgi:plastocyanin|uniref:Blue (type 1) copper domain-containing protein n=1 Tax=Linnemannia gamsii TaxID=64522 RepID=A0A9P6QV41_9FUNG|nr:hypothetical protein BGZ97_002182 [Linnemannia gamsii]
MRFSIFAIVSAIFIPVIAVAAEPNTVDVVMALFQFPRFDPPSVDINVGDTVRWTNKGLFPPTVDEGASCLSLVGRQAFKSGFVLPGGIFEHKFDKAGEFSYVSMPHCFIGTMKGTVSVKENPTSTNGA